MYQAQSVKMYLFYFIFLVLHLHLYSYDELYCIDINLISDLWYT